MKILTKSIVAGNRIIMAGSNIDAAGLECDKIPVAALEGQGSIIAESVLHMLMQLWPDGFTKNQLIEKFGSNINDCTYAILQVNNEHVLMLKTTEDEAIELYLTFDGTLYKFDGEYHVASDARQSVSLE